MPRKKVESLFAYARWEFGDRQKLASFDSISDNTNAALIAMGVISEPEKKERERPELPEEFSALFDHYKRLRFGCSIGEDVVTLIPRDPLTYAEIDAYMRATSAELSPTEIDIIMSLDAIFENREVK